MIVTSLYYSLIAIGIVLLVLCGILLIEVLYASLLCALEMSPAEFDCSAVILIPAHNEEHVLKETLVALQPELNDRDKILVVADNCTDTTVAIAQTAGAQVLERHDTERKGKGYALDYGFKSLETNPPDVVIVIDADCLVQAKSLQNLKSQAMVTQQPAQAVYLMQQPNESSIKSQISAFAFKVKNWIRPLGLQRLGIPCLLTGTGMAFPWATLSLVEVASSEIVEDMKMGLDLAIAGSAPLLCPNAFVLGQLPSQNAASTSQRKRWEHGHLQILLRYVPRLLSQSIVQKRGDLAIMALDLAIPPLSLFVMIWSVIAAVTIGIGWIFHAWTICLLVVLAGLALFVAITLAWYRFGREDLPIRSLLLSPLYVLWKIPLYIGFLMKPQSQWIRTDRDT